MSNCATCIHHDRDCVIEPPEGDYCRQYHPTILSQITSSRGTTSGEMTSMHVESENPEHYRNKSVEPIDAIRAWLGDDGFVAYCRGNIIKYTARLGDKDAPISEAKKAQVYVRWVVETLEGKELSK